MSQHKETHRLTVPEIRGRKGEVPVVCLTAYSAPMARFLDPYVDLLLVGDSLGMVVYGFPSTLAVTLEMMIAHGAAVVRGSQKACVAVDLPFGSYQESPQAAFRAATRVLAETGCAAVKLEGGAEMAPTIAFLAERNIPVMGHIGLRPQNVHQMGGYRAQGRGQEDAARLLKDAEAVAGAGAFAIVIEGTMEDVARQITETVPVPTIGIGASVACDGQILVTEDIVGLSGERQPKFVRRYGDLDEGLRKAAAAYAADVRARNFPGPKECFTGPRPVKTASAPGRA